MHVLIQRTLFMNGLRVLRNSFLLLHCLLVMFLGEAHGRSMKYHFPVFEEMPNNITFNRGDTAILKCGVRNLGTKEVIWKKVSDPVPLTVGKLVYVSDSSLSVSQHKNEWNLMIKNVQPHHAGLYECQISTKEELMRFVNLNVLNTSSHSGKKEINITGPPFVEKGNKIKLTCNATGHHHPPDDVDWFKDGLKIKSNAGREILITKYGDPTTNILHSTLEIHRSKMTDSGIYICRSSNLDITSHTLMVLNADTKPIKRGTHPDDVNSGVASGSHGNRQSSIHGVSSTGLYICLVIALYSILFSSDGHLRVVKGR